MVCTPSRRSCLSLIPRYTPSCFPLLDGVSAFPRVVPLLVSLCWMVCPPSQGSCLALSPIVPLIVSLGWCVRLPEGLVSTCLPSCFHLLDGVSGFRRVLPPLVSHSDPSCIVVLDGVSAFPRVVSPLVSHCLPFCFPLSAFARVLPPLVSHCIPSCFPWMVCPPFQGSCLPSSPFVGWCVRLPEVLSPCLPWSPCLFLFVGFDSFSAFRACFPACLRHCSPLLDGAFAFPRLCFSLPSFFARVLSPFVSHCALLVSLCWMVCPEVLSPLVFLLVSLCWIGCPPSRGFVSLLAASLLGSCLPLSPCVPLLVSLCWMVCPPSRGSCLPCLA